SDMESGVGFFLKAPVRKKLVPRRCRSAAKLAKCSWPDITFHDRDRVPTTMRSLPRPSACPVRLPMSDFPRIGTLRSFSCSLVLLLALLGGSGVRAADPFQDRVIPFLKAYCVRCHNHKVARGELNLARFTSAAGLLEDFRQWEHVVTFLKKEEMPPKKAKQ